MASRRRTKRAPNYYANAMRNNNSPCVIDVFSGAGGLSLGAARAGFNVIGAVDLDGHALDVHQNNFPGTAHINDDVSKLSGDVIKYLLECEDRELAGIIGGPPCQGFSAMGKNNSNDVRNHLFVDFFRIVMESLPHFYMAENVPGIMNEQNECIRNEAFSLVANKYVILPPMKLSASSYGAPTTRTRVFFVGYRKDKVAKLTKEDFNPKAEMKTVKVGEALQGLPIKIKPEWQEVDQGWRVVRDYEKSDYSSRLCGHVPPGVGDPQALKRLSQEGRISGCLGTRHSRKVEKRYASIEPGKCDPISKSHKLDPNGFCPTLRAGTGPERGSFQAVRPLHPHQPRVITPREAARLQGFPDWFQFSSDKWHSFRQIGSSVCPLIAEHLLKVVRVALT